MLSFARTATAAPVDRHTATVVSASRDPESRAWIDALALPPGERDDAARELHAYLLRVARFELTRRKASLGQLAHEEISDLAMQSADDALMAILRKLHTFRGDSRFTTWAAKFAILEAATKARRRAWQHREVTLRPDDWQLLAAADAPQTEAEHTELLRVVRAAIERALTPHQREVLVAITLNDVPIDVLADRLETTRGAIYKTLHDARRNLRDELFPPEER